MEMSLFIIKSRITDLKMYQMYSQGPKVFPQFFFPIDSNAFSSLHEALYCVVSRLDNTYFVVVVKLNDRCTYYAI